MIAYNDLYIHNCALDAITLMAEDRTMTVLVLGSTGTVGPHVVHALRARGSDIRVIVRNAERARSLFGSEVDVVEGDVTDPTVLHASLDGVDAVFLLTPHGNMLADVQLRIVRELRRTGIKVVKLSATSSTIRPDGPQVSREHWEVEEVLKASGQPFVILRPNVFMQSAINQIALPAIRATGKLPNAIGRAGLSFIDAQDIGAVAATVLTEPGFDGETLVLTGPRAVTYREVAELIGAARRQQIELMEITPAQFRESQLARGVEPWEAEHFEEMFQIFRDSGSSQLSEDVERVTGQAPGTIENYLERQTEALRDAGEEQRIEA